MADLKQRASRISARSGASSSIAAKWTILVAVALLVSFPGYAQDEPAQEDDSLNLTMDVEVGFAGRIRQACYFPVRITLENQGQPRRGEIRIVSQDPTRPLSAAFVAECDIPGNSRKTYVLYPYFVEIDPSPGILVQYVERIPLLTRQADLQFLQNEERLWVEVEDEGPAFTFLSGLNLPNCTQFSDLASYATAHSQPGYGSGYSGGYYSQRGSNQPPPNIPFPPLKPVMVGCHPQDLPNHVDGYQAVDGIILNSRRFYELSEDQQTALTDWVLSGGKVIAWLGDDPARYQGTFLTGAVDGSGWTGPSALTEPPVRATLPILRNLPAFVGQNSVTGNFPVTFAPQKSARVLLADGEVPLLQHIQFGRGDIMLSGLDLASLKSSSIAGLDRYFSFIIGYLATTDDRMRQVVEVSSSGYGWYTRNANLENNPYVVGTEARALQDLNKVLESDNLTALPRLGAIALFLIIYIITIGPINYIILLKMRRREWLWYTIPLLVSAFCVLAYGWALQTKGIRLLLTRINIEDAYPAQEAGWQTTAFGLFSPASRYYDIRLEGSRDLVRGLEVPTALPYYNFPTPGGGPGAFGESGDAGGLTLVQDGRNGESYIKDSYIKIWLERHFRSEGAIPFAGNASVENARVDGDHLLGTLDYSLDYDLSNPYVIYRTHGGFVASRVAPDQGRSIRAGSKDFDLDIQTRVGMPPPGLGQDFSVSGKALELRNVGAQLLTYRTMDITTEDELILAGWRDGPADRRLQSPMTRSATEETLVLIHVPLQIDTGDFRADGARGSITGIEAVKTELGTSGELLLTSGQMTCTVTFPPIDNALKRPEFLDVEVFTGLSRTGITVYAFDHQSGGWSQLRQSGSDGGSVRVSGGDFDRYLAPDNRTVSILVKGDPGGEDPISITGLTVNGS